MEDPALEPTFICPLCRWDLDMGGFHIWEKCRRRLVCPKCGAVFISGDVVFDHDLGRHYYAGDVPLYIAANVFWSMRTLSKKEFFEEMTSYNVSEEEAILALMELINRRKIQQMGDKFSLLQ